MDYKQKHANEVVSVLRKKVRRFEKLKWFWGISFAITLILLISTAMGVDALDSFTVACVLASVMVPNWIEDLSRQKLDKQILSLLERPDILMSDQILDPVDGTSQ